MNTSKNVVVILLFLVSFCSFGCAQQSPTIDTSEKIKSPEVYIKPNIAKLKIPTLEEEISVSEIEPRSRLFKINLRFQRADYSEPPPIGQQYQWSYFMEADILINFVKVPEGYFSKDSADDRKKKAIELFERTNSDYGGKKISEKDIKIGNELGKEFEIKMKGRTTFVRTFAHQNVWYMLLAQPKIDTASPLIEKLFDSFEFVE